MNSTLHPGLLIVVIPLVGILTLRYPLHWLLLVDILFVAVPGNWEIAGVMFDPSDLLFMGIVIGLYRRRAGIGRRFWRRVPYFRIWLLLGVLLSISYLVAPSSQQNLTDPFRVVYQLYRYAWTTIAYYPFAVLLLGERRRMVQALLAVVVAGDLCALLAIPEGLAGERANGPFTGSNELGAALIFPILICLAFLILRGSRARTVFSLISLALMGRAFLYSGSRGAFVGLIFATALFAWLTYRTGFLRSRVQRFLVLALVAGLALLAVKPDLFDRPLVRRMLSSSGGAEVSTMTWRMEQRWPHFWDRATSRPMLGWGEISDQSLGTRANTPHNGYLAVAVKHGFPALGLYLLFVALALRDSLRVSKSGLDPPWRMMGSLLAATLVGFLVHNMVDNIFVSPFPGDLFWLLAAMTAMAALQGAPHAP